MRRKEFLLVGSTEAIAVRKCSRAIKAYLKDRTDWKMLVCETLKYEGNSRKLAGKWRCYARVQVGV